MRTLRTFPTALAATAAPLLVSSVVAVSSLLCCSAKDDDLSRGAVLSQRMPDGRSWTTINLNVDGRGSFCYDNSEANCHRYGRLYTWDAARDGCRSLGDGWRLPTDDEWRQMAKHYGGVRDESADAGQAAYKALTIGGNSGFDAPLGGNRSERGAFDRLEAHGFYWTASDRNESTAVFYNFGRGVLALNRHPEGDKRMAASVRCVRE
jgi:uncharacterized protein (TIGR02145 family)